LTSRTREGVMFTTTLEERMFIKQLEDEEWGWRQSCHEPWKKKAPSTFLVESFSRCKVLCIPRLPITDPPFLVSWLNLQIGTLIHLNSVFL
jgi:hypothetical protein